MFDTQWTQLNKVLDKEEKQFWNNQSIQNQVAMLNIQDQYKKNFAIFGMELEAEYADADN
jgi:hypothetical protein